MLELYTYKAGRVTASESHVAGDTIFLWILV